MYLSSCEDPTNAARGAIDHLTIAARDEFEDEDVLALQRLRRLWGRGGHNLDLVLVGLGRISDYGGIVAPYASVLAEHHVWESVTPFVPTRHPKIVRGTQVDSFEDQLIRGCEQLLGVAPIKVSPAGDNARWARFRRRRSQGDGRRGPDRALGARLEFRNPVRGPIALGYGAHYGLGLFAAVNDS
jgi:CRISPR-associated protein Csb2